MVHIEMIKTSEFKFNIPSISFYRGVIVKINFNLIFSYSVPYLVGNIILSTEHNALRISLKK